MMGQTVKDAQYNKYLAQEQPSSRVLSSKSLKQKNTRSKKVLHSPVIEQERQNNNNMQTIQSFLSAKAHSPSQSKLNKATAALLFSTFSPK